MKKLCIGVLAALSVAAVSVCQAQTTVVVVQQPVTKVTLKINEPRSLMRQQKRMNMPTKITIGEKTFELPPGVVQLTVMHSLGNAGMAGQPVSLRIAYNNSTCSNIEIVGRPMQHPNRMLTINVGEMKMPNGMLKGVCEKAVIQGTH